MLRGMGFSNNTAIYLASGRIYKAEKNMAPLLEMFPLLQTKETLASDEELAPFKVCRMVVIFLISCLFRYLLFKIALVCRTSRQGRQLLITVSVFIVRFL